MRGPAAALLAATALVALAGCSGSGAPGSKSLRPSTTSASTPEPFTHQQQLVEQGARLIVADGCAACHLAANSRRTAPSFSSFAGHRVVLADGRSALVDERFLREALLHPRANPIRGYDPAPMVAAVERLHLSRDPGQVTALAAFIEEIGPEPE
jgi:hypothetical protein